MAKTQRRTSTPRGGELSEELSSIGAVKRYSRARLIQRVERRPDHREESELS